MDLLFYSCKILNNKFSSNVLNDLPGASSCSKNNSLDSMFEAALLYSISKHEQGKQTVVSIVQFISLCIML